MMTEPQTPGRAMSNNPVPMIPGTVPGVSGVWKLPDADGTVGQFLAIADVDARLLEWLDGGSGGGGLDNATDYVGGIEVWREGEVGTSYGNINVESITGDGNGGFSLSLGTTASGTRFQVGSFGNASYTTLGPGSNEAYSLGSAGTRWLRMYAKETHTDFVQPPADTTLQFHDNTGKAIAGIGVDSFHLYGNQVLLGNGVLEPTLQSDKDNVWLTQTDVFAVYADGKNTLSIMNAAHFKVGDNGFLSSSAPDELRVLNSTGVTDGSLQLKNLTATGAVEARGAVAEQSGVNGVRLGTNGGTSRVILEDGSTAWQIDNNNGQFRWYLPGSLQMTIDGGPDGGMLGSLNTITAMGGEDLTLVDQSGSYTLTDLAAGGGGGLVNIDDTVGGVFVHTGDEATLGKTFAAEFINSAGLCTVGSTAADGNGGNLWLRTALDGVIYTNSAFRFGAINGPGFHFQDSAVQLLGTDFGPSELRLDLLSNDAGDLTFSDTSGGPYTLAELAAGGGGGGLANASDSETNGVDIWTDETQTTRGTLRAATVVNDVGTLRLKGNGTVSIVDITNSQLHIYIPKKNNQSNQSAAFIQDSFILGHAGEVAWSEANKAPSNAGLGPRIKKLTTQLEELEFRATDHHFKNLDGTAYVGAKVATVQNPDGELTLTDTVGSYTLQQLAGTGQINTQPAIEDAPIIGADDTINAAKINQILEALRAAGIIQEN